MLQHRMKELGWEYCRLELKYFVNGHLVANARDLIA